LTRLQSGIGALNTGTAPTTARCWPVCWTPSSG